MSRPLEVCVTARLKSFPDTKPGSHADSSGPVPPSRRLISPTRRHKRARLAARKYFYEASWQFDSGLFSPGCDGLFLDAMAFATIFGSVRGVVHDPQHRPVQGVHVTLKAQNSDWTQSADSNDNGEFGFTSVPIGNYTVTATSKGFQEVTQDVVVQSDTSPVLHFQLAIAGGKGKRPGTGNRWHCNDR